MPDECENPTTDTAINALTCDDVEEIYCCQLRASPTCLNSELFVATMGEFVVLAAILRRWLGDLAYFLEK